MQRASVDATTQTVAETSEKDTQTLLSMVFETVVPEGADDNDSATSVLTNSSEVKLADWQLTDKFE